MATLIVEGAQLFPLETPWEEGAYGPRHFSPHHYSLLLEISTGGLVQESSSSTTICVRGFASDAVVSI